MESFFDYGNVLYRRCDCERCDVAHVYIEGVCDPRYDGPEKPWLNGEPGILFVVSGTVAPGYTFPDEWPWPRVPACAA